MPHPIAHLPSVIAANSLQLQATLALGRFKEGYAEWAGVFRQTLGDINAVKATADAGDIFRINLEKWDDVKEKERNVGVFFKFLLGKTATPVLSLPGTSLYD